MKKSKNKVTDFSQLKNLTDQINNSNSELKAVEAKQQKIDIAVLDVLHDKSATLKEIVAETGLDKFVVAYAIQRINSKQTWIDFERVEGNFKKFFLVKITKRDEEC